MLVAAKEIGIDHEVFVAMLRNAWKNRVSETRFNVDSTSGKRLVAMYASDMLRNNPLRVVCGNDIQGRRFVARNHKGCIEVIVEKATDSDEFMIYDYGLSMVA